MANERTEGEAATRPAIPGNGERQSAADPFPRTRTRPAEMTGYRGRSISREALRMVILKYLSDTLKVDVVELMVGAQVSFLDADDKNVPLDEVTVTWDER